MAAMKGKDYRKALQPLQHELNAMQRWLQNTGQRMMVVFEGRDTAGKGGAIGCFTDCLNPRSCHVVALAKPNDRERTQWYFQRYVEHLPAAGEIALFDRSWYNRAGVERVMGFCTDAQYQQFLDDCPKFERMLVNDGILLFKYWFGCDQEQQEKRLAERLTDPVKQWKISPIDMAARQRYADYTKARDAMLRATNIAEAPWTLVDMNDQKLGRLNMLRHLIDSLPEHPTNFEDLSVEPLAGKLGRESYPKGVAKVAKRY